MKEKRESVSCLLRSWMLLPSHRQNTSWYTHLVLSSLLINRCAWVCVCVCLCSVYKLGHDYGSKWLGACELRTVSLFECVCVVLWGPSRSCLWQLYHEKHLMKCCIISSVFVCVWMYVWAAGQNPKHVLFFHWMSQYRRLECVRSSCLGRDFVCVCVVRSETGCLPWTCVYIACLNL